MKSMSLFATYFLEEFVSFGTKENRAPPEHVVTLHDPPRCSASGPEIPTTESSPLLLPPGDDTPLPSENGTTPGWLTAIDPPTGPPGSDHGDRTIVPGCLPHSKPTSHLRLTNSSSAHGKPPRFPSDISKSLFRLRWLHYIEPGGGREEGEYAGHFQKGPGGLRDKPRTIVRFENQGKKCCQIYLFYANN